MLNLTSDRTVGGSGFVTAYPCGEARPLASSLNIDTGTTVPNLVSVRVGAEGKVCLYSSRRTDLIADVVGWYRADATGSALQALSPVTSAQHP